MAYGELPYGKLKTTEVQRKVRDGLRLSQPEKCPDDFYAVMSSCWRVEPTARPHFQNLHKELM
jgi:hypothetical protein